MGRGKMPAGDNAPEGQRLLYSLVWYLKQHPHLLIDAFAKSECKTCGRDDLYVKCVGYCKDHLSAAPPPKCMGMTCKNESTKMVQNLRVCDGCAEVLEAREARI